MLGSKETTVAKSPEGKKHLPGAGQGQDGEDTGHTELETQELYLKSPAVFIC